MVIGKVTRRSRRLVAAGCLLGLVAAAAIGGDAPAVARQEPDPGQRPTIVLVHGDWADASSWNAVIPRLQARGFTVVAPPNTLRGVSQDAAYLASYLATIPGPIVLVAHSYGGFVATNAATGNANVRALVYIDAFAPDEGDTLLDLTTTGDSCITESALNPVPIDGGADLYLRWDANGPYAGYMGCFANGIDRRTASLLFATQRPGAAAQFTDPAGAPAWATIPSWSLIGTLDQVIPQALQEEMSTRAGAEISRVLAGHLSLISNPRAVVRVILSAVEATS